MNYNKTELWLRTRGSRNLDDIVMYENRPCVMMWSSEMKREIPIIIPEEKDIHIWVESKITRYGRFGGHVHCENERKSSKRRVRKVLIKL